MWLLSSCRYGTCYALTTGDVEDFEGGVVIQTMLINEREVSLQQVSASHDANIIRYECMPYTVMC